jgi:hypothetical protein
MGMMKHFPYSQISGFPGFRGMPLVEVHLSNGDRSLKTSALIDSGSALNILPYDIGLRLGLEWDKQTIPLHVNGLLQEPGFFVTCQATIDDFSPIKLLFVWIKRSSQEIRLIFGQMNFFLQYRVTFDGRQGNFGLAPYE